MKMPIAWHETCLKNVENTLKNDLLAIERAKEKADRTLDYFSVLKGQISQAKLQQRDSFDANTFMKKRTKKDSGK